MQKNEYRGLSNRARQLISRPEGLDVDYKRALSGLDATDLIAFANSTHGGSLLIGVDETQSGNGVQKGVVVGCPVDDGERLKIINKAEECVPPVELEIFIENSAHHPFFRIEIPPSRLKPHCTKKGTYMIRGDGRNIALLPDRLLMIFLQTEGEEFLKRFKESTRGMEKHLDQIRQRLENELENLVQTVLGMAHAIDQNPPLENSVEKNNPSQSNAASNRSVDTPHQHPEMIEKQSFFSSHSPTSHSD